MKGLTRPNLASTDDRKGFSRTPRGRQGGARPMQLSRLSRLGLPARRRRPLDVGIASTSRPGGAAWPAPCTTTQQRRGFVAITPELGKHLQIDARRQAKPSRLSQLIVTAQCFQNLQSIIVVQLHKELRVRIGHQILRLQHVIPPSRGVSQLLALHIDVYNKLWALDDAINNMSTREPKPVVLESFNGIMSEIEGRMSTVVETLMEGLKETQRIQDQGAPPPAGTDLPTPIVTSQVDRFLQARIGIATLVRHYLDIQKAPGVETFVPPTDPIVGAPAFSPGNGGASGNGIAASGPSFPTAPPSEVRNRKWGSVIENCSIKELVEDCRAEVDQLSQHYYLERTPSVNIVDEPPGAYATLIPAHFHHTLFEILKNAYKATVESAQRKNLNTIPAIQVRILPGQDEVCVRVRDYADGMSLKTMAKATSYLYTSSETYEKQLEAQRSYQPLTEAMSGMGIGLPVSRLYARHWGGDIRVISVQGWGTDVAIYMSKKDVPEAIPIRVFD